MRLLPRRPRPPELQQLVIARHGSFDVTVDDGDQAELPAGPTPSTGLYIGPMVWRDMVNFSPGAVGLVLASEHYDEADYYRDYDEFLRSTGSRVTRRRRDGPLPRPAGHLRRAGGPSSTRPSARVLGVGLVPAGPGARGVRGGVRGLLRHGALRRRRQRPRRAAAVAAGLGIGAGDEVIVPVEHLHRHLAGGDRRRRHAGAGGAGRRAPSTSTRRASRRPITPRTAAILPVHLYGQPADMDAIARDRRAGTACACSRTPRRRTAPATAAGRVGALGDAAAFSFYPGKNLGALGDGGAVVTDDARLADAAARCCATTARAVKYRHEVQGYNSPARRAPGRRAAGQAARSWTSGTPAAAAVAARYLEGLADLPAWRCRAPAVGRAGLAPVRRAHRAPRTSCRPRWPPPASETLIHYPVAGAPLAGLRRRRSPRPARCRSPSGWPTRC